MPPLDAIKTTVPSTVVISPGISVCESRIRSPAESPVRVKSYLEKLYVELWITIPVPPDKSEYRVSEIVIASSGVNVCPSISNAEAALADITEEPSVRR